MTTPLPLSPFIDEGARAANVEQACLRAVEDALVEGLRATPRLLLSRELAAAPRPRVGEVPAEAPGWSEPIIRMLATG